MNIYWVLSFVAKNGKREYWSGRDWTYIYQNAWPYRTEGLARKSGNKKFNYRMQYQVIRSDQLSKIT